MGQFTCHHCHDVERSFHYPEDLAHHIELRHGTRGKYGSIEGPPKKPEASGGDFERVFASLKWDRDLLRDQIEEIESKCAALEDMIESVRKLGKLNINGKAMEKAKGEGSKSTGQSGNKATAKTATKKKPAKKKTAPASKAKAVPVLKGKAEEESNVGLPPSKGGTPPPGKPHWDKRAGRWTAQTPKQERVAKADRGKPKTEKRKPARYEADQETAELDGGGEEVAQPEVSTDVVQGDDVPGSADVEKVVAYVLEHNKNGADVRWRANRVEGLSDQDLLQRINYELGNEGQKRGPDWLCAWRREKGQPQVMVTASGGIEEHYGGQVLIDMVRETMGIDVVVPAKKAV